MRKDTKITKVYYFEELSERIQQKILEKFCELNVDYEWWDWIREDAREIGVEIEEFDLDRGRFCRGMFIQDEQEVAELILQKHGKHCDTYQDAYEFVWDLAEAEDEFYDNNRVEAKKEGIPFVLDDYDDFDASYECQELLDEFRYAIFEDYRTILQEQYEYLTSEEAIRETIDANEYEFTEDGTLYR